MIKFDINSYQYLSYMKVLSRISLIKPTFLAQGIEASAQVNATGGTTLKSAMDAGITAEMNAKYSVTGDGTAFDSTSKIHVRSAAPSIIKDISKIALPIKSDTKIEPEDWFYYNGKVRFGIRYHDNFRNNEENAPKLAFWSFITPDTDGDTVTLYALTGTVDGNLVDFELDKLPTSRAGSNTMGYFLDRFKEENALKSDRDDSRFMEPHWIATHTLGTLSNLMDTEILNLEILFQVKKILSIDLEGENSVGTNWDLDMNIQDSFINEKKVSKVVIGSPICTQKNTISKNSSDTEISLSATPTIKISFWERSKKFFGF